jgi:hypothetical protein
MVSDHTPAIRIVKPVHDQGPNQKLPDVGPLELFGNSFNHNTMIGEHLVFHNRSLLMPDLLTPPDLCMPVMVLDPVKVYNGNGFESLPDHVLDEVRADSSATTDHDLAERRYPGYGVFPSVGFLMNKRYRIISSSRNGVNARSNKLTQLLTTVEKTAQHRTTTFLCQ